MKISRNLFSILLIHSAIIGYAQVNFFKGTFEEAKKEAKSSGKKLFVDCYTTWCGPCKMLDKNVFNTKEFSDFISRDYVPLKLDMEREGQDVGFQYGVGSFPTMLILDADGKEITRIVGYRNTQALIASLDAKQMQVNDMNIQILERKYKQGEKSVEFLKEYISALAARQRSIEMPYLDYLDEKGGKLTDEDKEWVWEVAQYYNSSATEFILENKKFYLDKKKDIDAKLIQILKNSTKLAGENNDKTTLEDILDFISRKKLTEAAKYKAISEMNFYLYSKDYNTFTQKAQFLTKKYSYTLDEFENKYLIK